MRTLILYFLINIFFVDISIGQDKPAYQLFDADGRKTTYKKMLQKIEKADIVLFGEFHNNPIVHWLQYEVTDTMRQKRNLILKYFN